MKILFQPAGKRCFKWPSNGSEALALNLGTGRSYSILGVVSAIERVTGHPVPVTFNHLAASIQTHNATIHGLPFVTGFPSAINRHPFYTTASFSRAVFVFAANNLSGWTDVQVFLLLPFLSFVICSLAIFIAMTRR